MKNDNVYGNYSLFREKQAIFKFLKFWRDFALNCPRQHVNCDNFHANLFGL